MFGVTPCPVTIFTFGLFLLTVRRFSYWLLIIPFVWSLIGGSAGSRRDRASALSRNRFDAARLK